MHLRLRYVQSIFLTKIIITTPFDANLKDFGTRPLLFVCTTKVKYIREKINIAV